MSTSAPAKAKSAPPPLVPLAPVPLVPPESPVPLVPLAKAPGVSTPSPPSLEFLVGGSASSSSSSKAPAAATAKRSAAKSAAKSKAKREKIPVPAIGGGGVYYDEYKKPFTHEPYGNWTFHCNRPGCPKGCQRTLGVIPRNMMLFKSNIEPLAFLHAWRDVDIDPILGHRKSPVPDQAVKDFYTDHYDALLSLRDMFYTP